MIDNENFTISGPLKDANPYLEKMIKFWKKTGKNLYAFLLTLEQHELVLISDALIEEDKKKIERKWAEIGRSIAIMAYNIEKAKDARQFTVEIMEFCKACDAFSITCGLAACEKNGDLKVTDNSYFFDPKGDLKIEMLNECFMSK